MRVWFLAIGIVTTVVIQAVAADAARFFRSLQKLAPTERLEQLCDYTALKRIRNDSRNFRPERAVASAGADIKMKNDTIEMATPVQSG